LAVDLIRIWRLTAAVIDSHTNGKQAAHNMQISIRLTRHRRRLASQQQGNNIGLRPPSAEVQFVTGKISR